TPAVRLAYLVAQGHAVVVNPDDTAVGDGGAEDIAREIFEDRLLALAPRRAVDDPGLAPYCGWKDQVRPLLLKDGPQPPSHQLGQRLDRDQKAGLGLPPMASIIGDT